MTYQEATIHVNRYFQKGLFIFFGGCSQIKAKRRFVEVSFFTSYQPPELEILRIRLNVCHSLAPPTFSFNKPYSSSSVIMRDCNCSSGPSASCCCSCISPCDKSLLCFCSFVFRGFLLVLTVISPCLLLSDQSVLFLFCIGQ